MHTRSHNAPALPRQQPDPLQFLYRATSIAQDRYSRDSLELNEGNLKPKMQNIRLKRTILEAIVTKIGPVPSIAAPILEAVISLQFQLQFWELLQSGAQFDQSAITKNRNRNQFNWIRVWTLVLRGWKFQLLLYTYWSNITRS